jgi:serpin B
MQKNITRIRMRALFLAATLGWAAAAQAAATPSFSASVSGAEAYPTLAATLRVADADRGQPGSVYLAAYLGGAWLVHDGTGWLVWQGGALPAYASGELADRGIEVAREFDAAALAGTQVYLGYGRDAGEMLANGRYGLVYTVPVPVDEARSSQPRSSATAPADADRQALTAGNRTFALDLYRQLLNDPERSGGNLFFSPLSISVALAMTYAGARGETAAEMANALHFNLSQERLHPAFGWLDLELAERGQGAQGTDGQPFRLALSNSLWGERLASFESPFLDTLARNYGAGIKLVDFIDAPEPNRARINDWVAERTAQRIQNLLPEGSVTTDSRLVLVNAVYFNAAWQNKFYEESTIIDAPFTRLDGTTGTVAMMNQTGYFNYTEGSGYQAVELPYDGGELSMLLILPASGQFGAFEQAFASAKLTDIQAALAPRRVRLYLPKFKFEGGFSVKTALRALGMNVAFGDTADFSGISSTLLPNDAPWRISDIYHKAYVDVDETGTEAAAATAVVVGTVTSITTPEPEPVEFRADRPFLFAILDRQTDTLVFLGRVVLP